MSSEMSHHDGGGRIRRRGTAARVDASDKCYDTQQPGRRRPPIPARSCHEQTSSRRWQQATRIGCDFECVPQRHGGNGKLWVRPGGEDPAHLSPHSVMVEGRKPERVCCPFGNAAKEIHRGVQRRHHVLGGETGPTGVEFVP